MLSVKSKRRCTFGIIYTLSLLGGIEYAVILPTLFLYLDNRFHAPPIFLGLVLSAFSFSGLFSSPIMGRWYDKQRNAKLIILVCNTFEIIGNVMYWMGLSEWFLLSSRLVAGLGVGYFSAILAEVTHGTDSKERTSVVSAVMASRQVGLLLGPGFNLFLRDLNFSIGPFVVDKYSSPGLFMAVLYLIMQGLVLLLYYPLSVPSTHSPGQSSISSTSSFEQTQVTKPRVVNELPPPPDDNKKNTQPTIKQIFQAITREEIQALFMTAFVSQFNQTAVETFVTPISNKYLGFGELEISLMFCGAGVLILVSFALVSVMSKKFSDRSLTLFGLLVETVSIAWLVYWMPRLDVRQEYRTRDIVVIMLGAAFDVFGLPFLFVCHISLFSKLIDNNMQGSAHGVRRTIGGVACILGPLWAGSVLDQPYLMNGVMLGLFLLAVLLWLLSYKLLQPKISTSSANGLHTSSERQPLLHSADQA